MYFVQTDTLGWICIVLAQWHHSLDTLFWFRANYSLLLILHVACLAEKPNTTCIVFGLTCLEREPTIYHTQGDHANHYTTNAVV